MKKILSVVLCSIFLITCSLELSGCILNRENPYPYRGEYKELYTTAIYSIPDAEGYMDHGEGAYDSDIYVWEQDEYGRTLFSYCEDYGNQVFCLIISQAYNDSSVYFYPEINYKLTFIESEHLYEGAKDDHLKNKTKGFYLKTKDKLKEANDWNKPIDKNKCVSYPITDHKVLGDDLHSLSSVECSKILNEYSKTLNLVYMEEYPHKYNRILQVDAEGKILHEIHGDHNNPYKKTDEYTTYSITLWVITDKDGNYDKDNGVMVMYSKANESKKTFIYDASTILEFKSKNGWKDLA